MNRFSKSSFVTLTGTFLAISMAAVSAQAELVGTTVTGTLNFATLAFNCFDPTAGCIGGTPAGDLNSASPTVTISATATEFGYADSANSDYADFTDNTLTIGDNVLSNAANWVMTFTDIAFAGLDLTETSDTFTNGGASASLSGDVLTVTWAGTDTTDGQLTADFGVATPEPSTPIMLLTGLVAVAGLMRRRFVRSR
jgi:hypothetical protein